MSRSSKTANRGSKSSTSPYDSCPSILEGRRKRVWKACEGCRRKKTKCDGDLVCKRYKDDGLVCTAGSRKKTEYKQIPRGYAEILETTIFVLNTTVQKLYLMVRNNKHWDLGEPELNASGSLVIHDIVSKLGCIRPSPDLPYAIPNGEEGLVHLKELLVISGSSIKTEDNDGRKHTNDLSPSSSSDPHSRERPSSSETYHSKFSKNYNPREWVQQQSTAKIAKISPRRPDLLDTLQPAFVNEHDSYHQFFLDTASSILLPMCTNNRPGTFNNHSYLTPYGASDDTLGPAHVLEYTAQYMKQQTQGPTSSLELMQGHFLNAGAVQDIQTNGQNDSANFIQGAIEPHMLWKNSAVYNYDQMAYIGDEDDQMSMA